MYLRIFQRATYELYQILN